MSRKELREAVYNFLSVQAHEYETDKYGSTHCPICDGIDGPRTAEIKHEPNCPIQHLQDWLHEESQGEPKT